MKTAYMGAIITGMIILVGVIILLPAFSPTKNFFFNDPSKINSPLEMFYFFLT
jgi:hypothetical protein